MTEEPLDEWSGAEMQELRRVFVAEAHELVESLQDALMRLESDPEEEILRSIKRYVHTLKGDSNSVGLTAVGTLCHRMEDILAGLMDGTISIDHEVIDLLLSCVDAAQRLLAGFEAGRTGDASEAIGRIGGFLEKRGKPQAAAKAALTEYEDLQAREAAQQGLLIMDVQAVFHPQCGEKSVAALMVRRSLEAIGRIISMKPDPADAAIAGADRVTVLLATSGTEDGIRNAAVITGITSEAIVLVRQTAAGTPSSADAERENAAGEPAVEHHQERIAARQGEMLRIEAGRVDRIMNLTAELIIGRSMIEQVLKDIEAGVAIHDISARLFAVNTYLDRTVTDLQKGVMKMRMVPVNHVFRKFPKMVRDLTAEKGKPVRLVIEGKETELDKGIVDALGEPLAHIIRNMIDHGIEDPERRLAAGKPAEGEIRLRAYHEAAQIVIEAADDGAGIDTGKLRRVAADKGYLTPADAEKLSEAEARDLIYLPGLSTAERVSETSGRGVGMDAVKAAVESLRGSIETETAPGKGSRFRLKLPLTLAVIRSLLFQAADRLYALPLSIVAEITKVMPEELATVDGRETLVLRDSTVSLVRLEHLFRLPSTGEGKKFALLLNISNRRVGILADRIVGQQELVIKSLDGDISRSGLVAGAAILGDGSVVMILDASAVVRKAIEQGRKGPSEA